jgi:hypothetical protein
MTTATKHDQGKPDLTMIPYAALEGIAEVMEFGKQKYGRDNWRLGFDDNNRVLAAALRHLFKFLDGQRIDDESGMSHLSHAIANLAFAKHYEKEGKL